jgi:hypothetical protein
MKTEAPEALTLRSRFNVQGSFFKKPRVRIRVTYFRIFWEASDGAITTAMARYSTPPAFSTTNDRFWSVQRGGVRNVVAKKALIC